jgi:hypothetical protein
LALTQVSWCKQLRRWLLTQECTLFKHRFRKLQPSAQTAFLVENSLPYQALPASEFTAVKDKLETIHRVRRAESFFAHRASPTRPA